MKTWKAINGLVAMVCIAGLVGYALHLGQDGAILSLGLAGIAGIAGVKIGGLKSGS